MSINHFSLLFFISALALGFYACSSTSTAPSTDAASSSSEEYIELPAGKSIVDFVGKKVWLMGKESVQVYQHMMKGSYSPDEEAEPEQHVYIDYNENGGQIVGYYKGFKIPKDEAKHKFYGKILSMSGAGKGGGTHTEYYIVLDKVE